MRSPCLLVLACSIVATTAVAQAEVDFQRDVQPILADRCFACHGPDANQRKGGLRLDVEAASRVRLPSGNVAIVPGDASEGELVRRIRSVDPGVRMPPPESKLALSDRERDVLQQWIEEGAEFSAHWSFRPLPRQVEVPRIGDDWVRNDVDRFVLHRLVREGLAPTPEAPRERLLRRANLALTGLPPGLAELAAFAADAGSDAFERQVDRLLASVSHAERMAVEWMDAARYADTYGYQSDVHRDVWPWRDWVIGAFDRNLPFDQFVTWQLAGDLLPGATRDQQLATAFLRLHRQTNEGGSVEEEFRVDYVADRVETVGTAMLGLTLGCAKCHDHKFDPISQRDYYGLFALFDDADEAGLYSHFTSSVPTPTLLLPTPEQERAMAASDRQVEAAEGALAAAREDRDAAFSAWLASIDGDGLEIPGAIGSFSFEAIADDGVLHNAAAPEKRGRVHDSPEVVGGVEGRGLRLDGEDAASFPAVADFTRNDPFTIGMWLRVAEHHDRAVVWHRSRAWTDAASRGYELLLEDGRPSAGLIHFWPGNAIRVVARDALEVGRWTHVAVVYDGSSRAAGLRILIDGDPVAVDVVRDRLSKPITGGGADALTIGQRFRDKGLRGGCVDELRVFVRALAPLEVRELARAGAMRRALSVRDERIERAQLLEVFLAAHDPVVRRALLDVRRARVARSSASDPVREIMTMRDDCPQARVAYRLERGRYDARLEPVEPGVPAQLPPWPAAEPLDRLGLARWLTAPDHPLTARVVVNRIWQMHFGRGLVGTPEDFGAQGMPPTHPALLDWLARWLVDHDWDLKALHRLIVTSATFRQDSTCAAELRRRDPDNELLARGPSYRLPAETIRDSALFVSGLLVDTVGGPSVKPYQPAGLWREKSGAVYAPDRGDGLWRRSLYTYWKRTSPPPAMMIFDAGSREVCSVRRQSTSSPLQALVVWNDPQHVEAARILAERLLLEVPGDEDARLDSLFRRVVARSPLARERHLLVDALGTERRRLAADADAVRDLLAVGTKPHDRGLDRVELAAWTTITSTLLSFDEAITLR